MHAWLVGPGARGREAGDAHRIVERVERVVAHHDIQTGDGFAVRRVDGEPCGVTDDVEAGVDGVPLRGEPAAEQPVDLHPRWSSLRRFSRRELVMRTPRESLSMTSAPGW